MTLGNLGPNVTHIELSHKDSIIDSARAERDRNLRKNIQIGAAVLLAAGLVFGYVKLEMYKYEHPDFSSGSKEIIAPSNDIDDTVNMIEYGPSANPSVMAAHITNDPHNRFVLKDGLQAGDKITIPASIGPLFP